MRKKRIIETYTPGSDSGRRVHVPTPVPPAKPNGVPDKPDDEAPDEAPRRRRRVPSE